MSILLAHNSLKSGPGSGAGSGRGSREAWRFDIIIILGMRSKTIEYESLNLKLFIQIFSLLGPKFLFEMTMVIYRDKIYHDNY